MARRSLQASTIGIQKARKAFQRGDWTQEHLAMEVGIETRQPIWKFFSGKPIERHIFQEICLRLGLDWQEIAAHLTEDSLAVRHSWSDECDIDALVQKVRSHRHGKIQAQCGTLRLLNVAQAVELNGIYVDVSVLDVPQNQNQIDVSKFSDLSLEGLNDHLNWSQSQKRVPALKLVSTYSNLVILGRPGSGKTTFLRYIAMQSSQGKLRLEQIPIFIHLRNFWERASEVENLSLSSYIHQELCNSGISEQQAESLLRYGKALILLDGLDEVQAKDSNTLQKQIRQLSEEYYNNQVIITCRSAAQQYQFEGFTDTEIADFDQAQIEAFVHKWFISVGRNSLKKGLAKAAQFIEKLQLLENRQIRELATTPLLLHLACSMFQSKADFPAKRSAFYKQGLDTLLFHLDEARGIERDSPYSSLSLIEKIKLLSHVAANSFEKGGYFLEKRTLQENIANYLRTLPTASSDLEALQLESEMALRTIEAQHGLLVKRGQDIYSFSHTAFQAHLTARNIISSSNPETLDKNLAQLAAHVNEPRWHQVLVCTAGLLEDAAPLLKLMQQQSNRLVADPKLQQFLIWLQQKSLEVDASYKPASIRAFYLNLVLFRKFYLNCDVSLALILDPDLAGNLVPDLALDLSIERVLRLSLNLCRSPKLDHIAGLFFAFPLNCDSIHSSKLQYEVKRSSLGESLQNLKNQLPGIDQGEETLKAWWNAHGETWAEKLRAMLIQHRNIGHSWQFNDQQWERLMQFQQSSKCLLDCLRSDCQVTPPVRNEIEAALLLPIETSGFKVTKKRTSVKISALNVAKTQRKGGAHS